MLHAAPRHGREVESEDAGVGRAGIRRQHVTASHQDVRLADLFCNVTREPARSFAGSRDAFDAQALDVERQDLGLAGPAQVAIAERADEDDLAADERSSMKVGRREGILGIEEEFRRPPAYCTTTSL